MKVKGWGLKSAHEGRKVLLHPGRHSSVSLPGSGHMIPHLYLSVGICSLLSVSNLLPCSLCAWYLMAALTLCDFWVENPH